jgi:hypothetical protein
MKFGFDFLGQSLFIFDQKHWRALWMIADGRHRCLSVRSRALVGREQISSGRRRGRLQGPDRRKNFIGRPTPAKGLVERNEIIGGRLAGRDVALLEIEFFTLCVEHV